MKVLFSTLVVMTMVSPLFAATLIQEDFEGPAAGTQLNTLGWSGFDAAVISSTVIDSGNSVGFGETATWDTLVSKGFSHTPGAGETYTFSATLVAPATSGDTAEVHIRDSSDPLNQALGMAIGYGSINFALPDVENYFVVSPQPTTATDVKMVLQGTTADFYYRANGAPAWTYVGQKTGLGWSTAAYDEVTIKGHGGYAGGVDSVLLTSAPVPEPSSILMIVTGLFGLLAYAWRKRK